MPDSGENVSVFPNADLIEQLYAAYTRDPSSVEPSWRAFFDGWELGVKSVQPVITGGGREYDAVRVAHMIDAFRTYGHLQAKDNPLENQEIQVTELSLENLQFSKEEWDRPMPTCGFLQESEAPLSALYEALSRTYCGRIGIEYMGLGSHAQQEWIQKKIEPFFPIAMSVDDKRQILTDLYKGEMFENFIHTRYVGQKRFSLEGAETVIPMLERLVDKASDKGVKQTLIGMAHRGRLNVLANVLGKSYALIFHEFEEHYTPDEGSGDVKYHKGFYVEIKTPSGHTMGVTLAANPSHLESVDPVVLGSAKAMQITEKENPQQVLPVLIHGDASVAGQGVVYETIQLSGLKGYSTGGTLHIVINNQIGFTTIPKDSRSTHYCTDIAKAFGAPIFHVNAENPEECVYAMEMAFELRQKFGCDVFIDLLCYRKYGHNEGDEPTFTQPLQYKVIKAKKSILTLYKEELLTQNVFPLAEFEALEKRFHEEFQKASTEARASTAELIGEKTETTKLPEPKTAIPAEDLRRIATQLAEVPTSFAGHPKVLKGLQDRVAILQKEKSEAVIDWATAETLAYATLLEQGVHVRISGQDVRRGTFSQRHAALIDQKQDNKYFPLSHLPGAKALFDIYNSPLSEFAVLGFEYGYTLVFRNALVIWEAQYGDFANGAQIITDQYLSASEEKWGATSGLTLFLPHGYEGQGPEHSSGRMERFLQLAADDNLRIVDPTTPAQLFHLLRRQGLYGVKKPLVVFTPKALLRHPMVVSPMSAFEEGAFQPVLADPIAGEHPSKILFCTGKVYFDLFAERQKRGLEKDIAILRIEQLYPFPSEIIKSLLQGFSPVPPCTWVQEEPANMGAYTFVKNEIAPILEALFAPPLKYAGRAASATTAAGSHALHKKQFAAFIDAALEK